MGNKFLHVNAHISQENTAVPYTEYVKKTLQNTVYIWIQGEQ